MRLISGFEVVPLTKEFLEESIDLVESIFDDEGTSLRKELEASVDEKEFVKYVKRYDRNMKSLEYFIAIDKRYSVLGIIGLYSLKKDYKDTYWIGWYCVDENERGKGIGKELLEFVINMAKFREKKYLCLYTSTDNNEAKAQKIYEQYGFFITKVIHKKGYEILYRKKVL